ncbi:MAG: sulfonate transport system permease protein [Clostridiales bacterium]|jgi:NitT/TauT family transport system permease protein|nr:sulfonate transport system permease protein [Clostridiales bacterium]MDK2934425.1 sulfonate transport system permease protein [Clostridiales bacterium]
MFPSPLNVLDTLIDGLMNGTYSIALLHSLRRLLIGYTIAVTLGIVISIVLATNKTMDETFGTLVLSLQSVPSVVWLPLALLWFKMGETSIIFVVVVGGIWNMIMNTSTGIKNVDPTLIRCGKNLGYQGLDLFTKIILPASIPHIITGMRLAWAFCWRALMAAEILSTGQGLGQILMWGRDMGNMNTVVSVMLMIAFTGLITDNLVFRKIELKIFEKWGLMAS